MKIQLNLEYVAFLVLGIVAFAHTEYSWWWFAGFFLAPDISMLGYTVNNKVGAFCYNLFHHLGVAIIVYLAGAALSLLIYKWQEPFYFHTRLLTGYWDMV